MWALGCILYEMVTGHHAFEADDLPSIFEMVLSGSYEPVTSIVPDVPARILMTIHGAMHIDRERRIPDCSTLLEVLSGEQWDLGRPADQTWSGSVDMAVLAPRQTLVPEENLGVVELHTQPDPSLDAIDADNVGNREE